MELFHAYRFSLHAGTDGIWVHWCAFTFAINAIGLLKASLMSLRQFQQKVSLLLSWAVGSGVPEKHVPSNTSLGLLSALRLEIPNWPYLYSKSWDPSLACCRFLRLHSQTALHHLDSKCMYFIIYLFFFAPFLTQI